MKIVDPSYKITLAGANIGDTILIRLSTNIVEKVILNDVTQFGIEGFDINLKDQPLVFYPFNAIIKITKYNAIE